MSFDLKLLVRLYKDEEGGELMEYVLIAALVVIACIAAIKLFTGAISGRLGSMGDELTNS